jgi:hypothetical protein
MKYLKLVLFLLVASLCLINQASAEAKIDNDCFKKCSNKCAGQMRDLISEISTHSATCRGEVVTVKPDAHICAGSCSWGCRSVMRGNRQIVMEYFDDCPGGDGSFGSLFCAKGKTGSKYFVFNSHTGKALSDGVMSSRCEELVQSHDYNVFCTRKGSRYVVASSVDGKTVGVSYPFINACRDSIRNMKSFKICVKYGNSKYSPFDLVKWKKASTKTYRSQSSCEKELNLAF